MTDIRDRLSVFRDLDPPADLWETSIRRKPRPANNSDPEEPSAMRRVGVIAVALLLAIASLLFVIRAFERHPDDVQPVAPVTNGPIAFPGTSGVWLVNPDGTGAHEIRDSSDME